MNYGADESFRQASDVIRHASAAGKTLAVAESCTGGLVCAALTDIPGASDALRGGVVSYANGVKESLLGVNAQTLASVGAVSEEVACAMAQGARRHLEADIAVSTTGIAGPGGGTPSKPVGTVWFGLSTSSGETAYLRHFEGDRRDVRNQAVAYALALLDEALT